MINTVKITKIVDECHGVKTFIFTRNNLKKPKPGQFLMIWLPGVDEIPMSISSYHDNNEWAVTVQNVGECTRLIHKLKIGDYIGVRGPIGNSFNIPQQNNKNMFLIGGGIGVAPLKFLASELKRLKYNFKLIIGAKLKNQLVFKNNMNNQDREEFEVHFCTDDGSYGEKGFTTDIFKSLIKNMSREELQNTVVFTCGPEIMMQKLLRICLENKIELQASLERIMRCGCGLCGLCVIDPLGLLVCNDGPIFTADMLVKMEDFGKYKRDFSGKKISI
jgi:dihydroorotate dehydrogenase electron transfer subunit